MKNVGLGDVCEIIAGRFKLGAVVAAVVDVVVVVDFSDGVTSNYAWRILTHIISLFPIIQRQLLCYCLSPPLAVLILGQYNTNNTHKCAVCVCVGW